jgi:pimeloyl-ACP methyl ester carboxylesterase
VPLATGVRLEAVAQGQPDGAPVVLLHGIGDSWHSFRLMLPHLPADFRVFSVTLRGHGESDRPPSGYLPAHHADDVLALMDALELPRATLVGHSFGSFVAQHVAARAPERVDRLVLIGSAAGGVFHPASRESFSQLFAAVTDPMSRPFAEEFQASTIAAAIDPEFFAFMVEEVRRLPARAWREFAAQIGDDSVAEGLRTVTAPTLLVWGERDQMFDRADQRALLDRLPHARLSEYPGVGHAVHWEQPAQVARDIAAFCNSSGGGAGLSRP